MEQQSESKNGGGFLRPLYDALAQRVVEILGTQDGSGEAQLARLVRNELTTTAGAELAESIYQRFAEATRRTPIEQPLDIEGFRTNVQQLIDWSTRSLVEGLGILQEQMAQLEAADEGHVDQFEEIRSSILAEKDSRENQIERIESVLGTQRSVRDALQRAEQLLAETKALHGSLESRLRALDVDMAAQEDARRKFRRRRDDLERTIAAAQSERWLRSALQGVTPADLQGRLADYGFLASEAFCRKLLTALGSSRRVIVLRGRPGTGKTTLATLLPVVLFGPAFEPDVESVEPAWTFVHVIGSHEYEAGQLGPQWGPITGALLQSLHDAGRHWLVLDESNRADPRQYLSGLLKPFAPETRDPCLVHPHGLYERDDTRARIPIPTSFRILCTENPHDTGGVYTWPQAWTDHRLEWVEMEEIPLETLETLLRRRVLDEHAADPQWSTIRDDAEGGLRQLMNLIALTRELVQRQPHGNFAGANASPALACEIVQTLVVNLQSGSSHATALDLAVLDRWQRMFRDAGRLLAQALEEEVFSLLDPRLPRCEAALRNRREGA